MKKMILAGVGGIALLGAAVGGTWFVMRPDPAAAPAAAAAAPAAAMPAPVVPQPVFYHHVQPEFVVNLPSSGRAKFLMVELSIALNDEQAKQAIDANQAELRNDLLLLLGEQNEASLADNEGKQALREQASEVVEALVSKHYAPGRVLDVYLTRFVIQ